MRISASQSIRMPSRTSLRGWCDFADADVICAALLHDSVEDHADDMSPAGRPGAFAMLTACFGPRVAGLVESVTNPTDTEIRAILSHPATVAVLGCSDNPVRDSLRIAMLLKRKGFRGTHIPWLVLQ